MSILNIDNPVARENERKILSLAYQDEGIVNIWYINYSQNQQQSLSLSRGLRPRSVMIFIALAFPGLTASSNCLLTSTSNSSSFSLTILSW